MAQMSWLARQDGYDPNAFDVPGEQTYDRRLDQTWPGQLAQDAIGAVLAPGRALQSTEPITTEQMIKPAVDLAGLVTGGSYAAPAQRGASGAGIRAYHSSPHDFDKFDLAKIGTGEGAQAYGHGLYFAENPAVSGQGGQYWQQFANRGSSSENTAAEYLARAGFDREKAAQTLRDLLANPAFTSSEYNKMTQARMRGEALKLLEGDKPVGPRTYEVNINADPAHMLDWEKPLSGHGAQVQDAIRAAHEKATGRLNIAPYLTGQEVYGTLQEAAALASGRVGHGSSPSAFKPFKVEAAEALREAGIPGIKYLDQGSRGAVTDIPQLEAAIAGVREKLQSVNPKWPTSPAHKDLLDMHRANLVRWEAELAHAKANPPTSNYVIFDPNIIDITKKYAVPGAIGAGGMGALAAQDRYEEVY